MTVSSRPLRFVEWLRAGYPAGIPPKDYIPLLALLRTRLTDEEVRQVAAQVADHAAPGHEDIPVRISRLTDLVPDPADVRRVEDHLVTHHGWPADA